MEELQPLEAPKEGMADKALDLAKALLGDIVPFGGTFAHLASRFIRTPYQKRLEAWTEQVGRALDCLASEKGVRLEDLQNDPTFVDTVLHATQVALRNANVEKRAALQNAIVNSGLPSAPDESRRQMFLNYIDSFTPLHLRLLAFFNEPTAWFRDHGKPFPRIQGARWHIFEAAYPEAKHEDALFRQIWRELYLSGLSGTESLHGLMTEQGLTQPATSDLGREFLAFISPLMDRVRPVGCG